MVLICLHGSSIHTDREEFAFACFSVLKALQNRVWKSLFWLIKTCRIFAVSTASALERLFSLYNISRTCRQFYFLGTWLFREYDSKQLRRAAYQYKTQSKAYTGEHLLHISFRAHLHDNKVWDDYLLLTNICCNLGGIAGGLLAPVFNYDFPGIFALFGFRFLLYIPLCEFYDTFADPCLLVKNQRGKGKLTHWGDLVWVRLHSSTVSSSWLQTIHWAWFA